LCFFVWAKHNPGSLWMPYKMFIFLKGSEKEWG